MCLSPITIKNRSKHISANAGSPYLVVKCGKCSECLHDLTLEWQHRAYSVYEMTRIKGGFTLFLSLTYSEEDVPRFYRPDTDKSIRVFSPEHIRNFRKTLYQKIYDYKYKGILYPFRSSIKDGFHYIITSEYGGLNKRPHYHCLFSCAMGSFMTPDLFYKFVKESWTHGYIDTEEEFRNHIVNSQGAICYVSKYMYKDDDFTSELKEMISEDKQRLSSYRFNKIYNKQALNKILPFHRQTQGYGLQILDLNAYSDLFENGYISMPDMVKFNSTIRLFNYIKYKLFYDLVDDESQPVLDEHGNQLYYTRGKYQGKPKFKKRWKLNQRGIDFKLHHIEDQIEELANSYKDKVENLKFIDNSNYVKCKPICYYIAITSLLQDRYKDLATYNLIYRGATWPFLDSLPEPKQFYHLRLLSSLMDIVPDYENSTDTILSSKYDQFAKFDEVLTFIEESYIPFNEANQAYYKELQRQRKLFKNLREQKYFNRNTTNIIYQPKLKEHAS